MWVAAAGVSNLGVAALYFALGWAASAHGGSAAGLVIATVTVARMVLLLAGGVIADRAGARTVMVVCDAVLLVTTTVLVVLAVNLGTPLWLLVGAAFVEGAVTAFYLPAEASLPRRLVEADAVPRAAALRGGVEQLADLLGGPLGGALVAFAGFALAAAVDAASFIPVLIVMLTIHPVRTVEGTARRSLLTEAGAGVALVARDPLIRTILGLVAVAAGVFVPVGAVLVPLLVRSHHWTAVSAGLIYGGLSLGGLGVTVVVSRRGTAGRPGPAGSFGLCLAGLGLGLLGLTGGVITATIAAVLAGAGVAVFTSHAFPLILLATPETYLSRVQFLLSLTQAAVLVAAAPMLGLAAADWGTRGTLFLTGALLLALSRPEWRSVTPRTLTPTASGLPAQP